MMLFSLGNVLTICTIVAVGAIRYYANKKDIDFIKGRIEYWFGSGNVDGKSEPQEEGKGIIKLKLYIQNELSLMDKRYQEQFECYNEKLELFEKLFGSKIKRVNGKNGRSKNNV